MSWIQKLYETYENCADKLEPIGDKLWPVSHIVKKAHVEIALDGDGNFRRARTLERSESPTLIPVTESSAGRTSGPVAHPFADELGYCAADYPKAKKGRFDLYHDQLSKWCASEYSHQKAIAVLKYIQKKTVWSDLNDNGIFPVRIEDGKGTKTKLEDGKVFVRWLVETPDDVCSEPWKDRSLINAWVALDGSQSQQIGFCMVIGEEARLAQNHPRFVRFPGDGGKIISSNDSSGYTFRGRFTDKEGTQACGVGFETGQKAHNALRWLIERQGYRQNDQAVVAWSVGGKSVPDLFQNTMALILSTDTEPTESETDALVDVGDAGQSFSLNLKKALAGYRASLDPTDDVVVMGLDSATPGRMAITFYREMSGSEFLDRIEAWHEQCAWPQNFGAEKHFVGAPAPKDIAEAAYGRRDDKGRIQVDEKIQKVTIERLLPSIIDGQPIPRDLIETTRRRAANRQGLDHWDWEKYLGIACALFKGYYKERSYQMALEEDRISRDYLYGRLLAVADSIESFALSESEKKRATTSARLMQRFSDRPFSTWRNIETALVPYQMRLKSVGKGVRREKLLDEIMSKFISDEFKDDRPLSGEFLLGFHCQRKALSPNGGEKSNEQQGDK